MTKYLALSLGLILSLHLLSARADENTLLAPPINPEPRVTETRSDPRVETTYNERVEEAKDAKSRYYLWFGGSLGYTFMSASRAAESSKNGPYFRVHATGSLYTEKMAFDLGLGWMYSRLKGKVTVGSVTTTTTITTQAGSLEFSPKWKIWDKWELGPVLELIYGTDASFGEDPASSTASVHFGGKLNFAEMGGKDGKGTHYRIGGKLMTDVTVQNRQLFTPMLFAEIGFPAGGRDKVVVREKETVRTEFVDREKIVEKVIKEEAKFVFDDELAHFQIDKARLLPESQKLFFEIGKYLAANPQHWSSIKISGHTDVTGSREHNLELSRARADSVATVLKSAGIDASRITAEGFGPDQPVDEGTDALAYARNRRVEISFGEGANAKELHDAISRIKKRTVKPQTCVGDRCH